MSLEIQFGMYLLSTGWDWDTTPKWNYTFGNRLSAILGTGINSCAVT